jgi:tRNA (guanine37-N1)-methyltransferase
MHFDIFTLFPGMFQGPFSESILKRAQERGLLSIALHNIRAATTDKHHVVDDYPYGGGAGMVMKPEPIFAAIEPIYQGGPIILLTPQGRLFNQRIAQELAQQPRITLLCGHYEGIDERVRQHLVTDEISIGDYVLTGGELAAMIVVDAVSRLLPGVLAEESTQEESHTSGLLEYPHYTRPPEFRGWGIPDVLLSGNHAEIARWRRKESLRLTRQRRPDLFAQLDLSSKADMKLLKELEQEET